MRSHETREPMAWWQVALVVVLVLGLAAPGAVKVVRSLRGEKAPAETTPAAEVPREKVAAAAKRQTPAPAAEPAKPAGEVVKPAPPKPTVQAAPKPAPMPAAAVFRAGATPAPPPPDPIETACAEYAQALEDAKREEQKWYDQTAGPRLQHFASAEYQGARANAANMIAVLSAQLPALQAEAARAVQAAQPTVYMENVRAGEWGQGGAYVRKQVVLPASDGAIRNAQQRAAERDACARQIAALVEQERLAKLNQDKELRSYAEELKRRVFARQVVLASRGKHQPAYQYLSKRKAVEDKKAAIESKQGVIQMLEQAGHLDKVASVQAELDVLKAELQALEAEVEQAAEAIRAQPKEPAAPVQN